MNNKKQSAKNPFVLSLSKDGWIAKKDKMKCFGCAFSAVPDGSYYTGHPDNLERRIGQYQAGKCEGYTATRRPVELIPFLNQ